MNYVAQKRLSYPIAPLLLAAALTCVGCAKQISTEDLSGHYVFVGPEPEASLDISSDGKYVLKDGSPDRSLTGTWTWEDVDADGDRRVSFRAFAFRGEGPMWGITYWPALPECGFGLHRIRIVWNADLGEYFVKQ
jgi:hypothetical protein